MTTSRRDHPLWPGEAGSTGLRSWRHFAQATDTSPRCGAASRRHSRGFTLLELMVVVAIIALATAGVSLALRDGSAGSLEREALRLSALLESARAQSRASGVPVLWRTAGDGFEFIGVGARPGAGEDDLAGRRAWLGSGTRALIVRPRGASTLVLGPDPLIEAQQVQLLQGERRLILGTDGLSPFAVLPDTGDAP